MLLPRLFESDGDWWRPYLPYTEYMKIVQFCGKMVLTFTKFTRLGIFLERRFLLFETGGQVPIITMAYGHFVSLSDPSMKKWATRLPVSKRSTKARFIRMTNIIMPNFPPSLLWLIYFMA